MKSTPILLVFLFSAFVGEAQAGARFGTQVDTIRCGRELVQVGQHAYQLLDKCGDPDFRQVVQYNRLSDFNSAAEDGFILTLEDTAYLVTEEWVYKQGRGRLVKILTVTGGILTDIRLADRE